MRTIGVRALRENPGVLSKCASKGEYVLVTNRNTPLSLSIPFTDDLLDAGVHINIAISLYQQGMLTLVKAACLAQMPVESFIHKLSVFGIEVVDQTEDELLSDLKALD